MLYFVHEHAFATPCSSQLWRSIVASHNNAHTQQTIHSLHSTLAKTIFSQTLCHYVMFGMLFGCAAQNTLLTHGMHFLFVLPCSCGTRHTWYLQSAISAHTTVCSLFYLFFRTFNYLP